MLSGIAYPSGATNSFTYNGLSQRIGKTDSTGTFAYTLTDDAIDATVLSDGATVYRQGVGLIGENKNGARRYYNSDSLGSTRAIADGTGNVSATRETDAFGNTVAQTGAQTPFGFAGAHGYQTDADSGLQKLGYRYYDASTGRFLSRDPIQGGYNWYAYCENDPVNAVDPEGLEDVVLGPPVPPGTTEPKDDKPKSKPPYEKKRGNIMINDSNYIFIDVNTSPRGGSNGIEGVTGGGVGRKIDDRWSVEIGHTPKVDIFNLKVKVEFGPKPKKGGK